jgi:hypothetical protein
MFGQDVAYMHTTLNKPQSVPVPISIDQDFQKGFPLVSTQFPLLVHLRWHLQFPAWWFWAAQAPKWCAHCIHLLRLFIHGLQRRAHTRSIYNISICVKCVCMCMGTLFSKHIMWSICFRSLCYESTHLMVENLEGYPQVSQGLSPWPSWYVAPLHPAAGPRQWKELFHMFLL